MVQATNNWATQLAVAAKQVKVGATYAHYKRHDYFYQVLTLAIHEPTEEVVVIYRALYGEGVTWSRPLRVWLEKVSTADGMVPRFRQVE